MKEKLEIGDEIQRFEVRLSKEIDFIYIIDSVTKTLAKSRDKVFKRELIRGTIHPKNSTNKIIARVRTKEKQGWTSPDYFLIEKP